MSLLLEKPAGAHGFIRSHAGHLVTGDERRWRAWGVNITFGDPMPSATEAPLLAGRWRSSASTACASTTWIVVGPTV